MYNRESYLRVLIGLAILVFVAQIILAGLNSFTITTVLSKASIAITIALIFHYIFSKWVWKFKILRPLIVKVPNLHGTWTGNLVSHWIDPQTGNQIPPINIRVYIRQTFNNVSVEVHTDKMVSISYVADFVTNPDSGVQELCYIYTSKSKLESRDVNPWHDGTTRLAIYDGPNPRLEGEYWTSRKTVGSLDLTRESNKIERF